MILTHRRGTAAGLIAILAVAGTIPAFAQPATPAPGADTAALINVYQTKVAPLFTGTQTIIGQTIAYPAGAPMVTSTIVTIPPGGETGWHTHAVPLFAYVLSGTATIDYGSKGIRTSGPGTAFFEALNWAHNAHNYADVPVTILAVYIGVEGTPNAATAPGAE